MELPTQKAAKRALIQELIPIYGEREADNLARIVYEEWFHLVIPTVHRFTPAQWEVFQSVRKRLLAGAPIQYILQKAWFFGLTLHVNEHTLIPRPETEELVEWILEENKENGKSMIDLGTGSGCIPIATKNHRQTWNITATDISAEAIKIAQKNSTHLKLDVDYLVHSMLEEFPSDAKFDVIVSNPPYVLESDKKEMHKNVLDFEPGTALFVPDADPLLFYKAISAFAGKHSKLGASVYVEVHEQFAHEVAQLFRDSGMHGVEVRKDIQERDRMVRGRQ